MVLYALGNQAFVTGFIEFKGIAESDQGVGVLIVGILRGVIKTPR